MPGGPLLLPFMIINNNENREASNVDANAAKRLVTRES